MKIANLDNEVHFKNVFTDVEVFCGFVKDVLGIDMNIEKVETEKVLPSQVSPIRFRMDLFAEDKAKRTIVEIQKMDYDYAYDRFSHYFFANLVDAQKRSSDYAYEKEVYLIVVVTSTYKIKEKSGVLITDDVLITDTNPRTLRGDKRYMHDHKMVILNAINADDDTPKPIKDWLDLIVESTKEEQDLDKINRNKAAINKAVQLAELNSLTPEQRAESKVQEMRKRMIAIREKEGFERGEDSKEVEFVLRLRERGYDVSQIVDLTGLSEDRIREIIAEMN